jgi:uroporphyrin-III C-methyltransferase
MSAEIESLSTDLNSRRPGRGVNPMLVALAVIGLLLAAYATWQVGRMQDRFDRLRTQVVELRAVRDRVEMRLQSLAADLESSRGAWRNELRGLREMPAQLDELGRSVEELRARTESPERAWVRAEALYLLELAKRRLELERDMPTAILAMESADARLAALNDPALSNVRTALDSEIAALRAVQRPDLPDVMARIGRLESGVPTLPMTGMPVSEVRRANVEPEDEGRLARAWQRLLTAAHDLVSLRTIEPATSRLVTQEEDSLRRQHLQLLLFSARIAAMQPDGAAYGQSLRAASAWIEQYFDTTKPAGGAALAEISALAAVNIDPALPPVGHAASLLQSAIRSGTATP